MKAANDITGYAPVRHCHSRTYVGYLKHPLGIQILMSYTAEAPKLSTITRNALIHYMEMGYFCHYPRKKQPARFSTWPPMDQELIITLSTMGELHPRWLGMITYIGNKRVKEIVDYASAIGIELTDPYDPPVIPDNPR